MNPPPPDSRNHEDETTVTTFTTLNTFKELYKPITNPWNPNSRYAFDKKTTPQELLDIAAEEGRLWSMFIRESSNNDDVTILTNEGGLGILCYWITEKPSQGDEVLVGVSQYCNDCDGSGTAEHGDSEDCQSCKGLGSIELDVSTEQAIAT